MPPVLDPNPLLSAPPKVTPAMRAMTLTPGIAPPTPTVPALTSPVDLSSFMLPAQPVAELPRVAAPSMSRPAIPSPPLTPVQQAQAKVDDYTVSGSGIDQIKNPLLRGIARGADIAGAIAGSVFAPLRVAETYIPGTQEHHQMLLNRAQGQLANAQQNALDQAKTQEQQAKAQQELAKASAFDDPQKAVDPSKIATTDDGVYQLNPATGHYDIRIGDARSKDRWSIHDTEAGPIRVNDATGEAQAVTLDGAPVPAKQHLTQSQPIMGPDGKPHTYLLNEHGDSVRDLGVHYERPIAVHVAPARDPQQMAFVPDGNGGQKAVLVRPGTTLPAGASRSPSGPKIDADEQKRADLAENLTENISSLEDILQRRPELFGPLRGRMTQLSNALGTDDQDIAQLMSLEHQLGMVAQGAHGMRSAQGVVAAAQALTNGFHNSPAATRAALEAARKSVSTFQADSQTPGAPRPAEPVSQPQQNSIPAAAAAQLQEGREHTFGNGQVWTKRSGQPVRVR